MSEFKGYLDPYSVGDCFGGWVIVDGKKIDSIGKHRGVFYKIRCECGYETFRFYRKLKASTMCYSCSTKKRGKNQVTHGLSKTRLYNNWQKMIARCYNVENKSYLSYGRRGIKVCDRWLDSYENFFQDVGEKPSPNHSLDRIDNNGDYSPANVRWATKKEQASNRRNTCYIDYNNERIALPLLAERFNIKTSVVYKRLKRGWDIERALKTPIRKK